MQDSGDFGFGIPRRQGFASQVFLRPFDFVCHELHCQRVWFARTACLSEGRLDHICIGACARNSRERKSLFFGTERPSLERRANRVCAGEIETLACGQVCGR